MSHLDFQQATKELRQWRVVSESERVIDIFCAKLVRDRKLQEIAADLKAIYGDRRAA